MPPQINMHVLQIGRLAPFVLPFAPPLRLPVLNIWFGTYRNFLLSWFLGIDLVVGDRRGDWLALMTFMPGGWMFRIGDGPTRFLSQRFRIVVV
jgi:hypothetical protein